MSTKMAECFVVGFVKKLYPITLTAVIALPGFLNGLVSSWFDKCWYLWWRKRYGKDILLNLGSKQRNIPDDTNWTFRGPRISDSAKIASKWRVCSSYFMFPFYFTPENLSWGNLYVESSFCCVLSITVLLFAEFILNIDRKILRLIFLVDFKLG